MDPMIVQEADVNEMKSSCPLLGQKPWSLGLPREYVRSMAADPPLVRHLPARRSIRGDSSFPFH